MAVTSPQNGDFCGAVERQRAPDGRKRTGLLLIAQVPFLHNAVLLCASDLQSHALL
jgi:hypothetical protein